MTDYTSHLEHIEQAAWKLLAELTKQEFLIASVKIAAEILRDALDEEVTND